MFLCGNQDDGPYRNAKYQIDIDIPIDYPQNPPKCRFIGFLPYHVNVYPNGNICLTILKDSGDYCWKKTYNLKIALDAIVAFFSFPNESSAANSTIKLQFIKNKDEYYKKIKENALESAKKIYI